MNLFVSDNLKGVHPDRLPSTKRDGPARILFLSGNVLGWKTLSRQLIDATASRPDVLACHVILTPPLWMKMLNRPVPGRHHMVNPLITWRWLIGRWLAGPLDPRRFDVIHCSPQTMGAAPAALKTQHRYKLTLSCDTTDRQYARELSDRPGLHAVTDDVLYRAADLIFPWSTWVAGSLKNDYGVDAARLVLTRPSASVPAEVLPREPRAGRLLRIAFVGNDFARKGGPRLLKWHQDRWADRAELHVASADAAGFAPAKNVVWHGRLDHAKVLDLLGSADLLVHPTQSDMSALVVAEAQSLGVPAVTSRLAGIPELVQDGVSGLLVDPADDAGFIAAVESVLFDPDRNAAMSAAAYAFAKTELNPDVTYCRALDRMVAVVGDGAV